MLGRRRGPDEEPLACTAPLALADAVCAEATTSPSAGTRVSCCAYAAAGTQMAKIVRMRCFMRLLRIRASPHGARGRAASTPVQCQEPRLEAPAIVRTQR